MAVAGCRKRTARPAICRPSPADRRIGVAMRRNRWRNDGMASLDDLDGRILRSLAEDSRQPATALARRLGVARTTVQERLARLERSGVIAGYTVRLGPAAL